MVRAGCVVLAAATAAAAAPTAPPVLPQQWSSLEQQQVMLNQGGERSGDQVCCYLDAASCKVQVSTQSGQFYFDGKNNRTRSGPMGVVSVVSLYDIGKEMQVDENNTCTSYCPLQSGFSPFGVDPKAKYMGRTSVQGVEVDQWQWTEYVFQKYHLLPMQQTNFFVSTAAQPVPVVEQDVIEPMGKKLGTENTTWAEFKAEAPAAALFDVKGVSSCPMDSSCNSDSRSAHRRRSRDLTHWAFYKYPQAFVEGRQL